MAPMKPTRLMRTFACALVLLLAFWVQTRVVSGTTVDTPIRADASAYVGYAWNLKTFGVFSREPTWLRSTPKSPVPDKLTLPGYPAFLSLFLHSRPDWTFVHRVTFTQALLGIGTCAFALLAGLRVLPFGWGIVLGLLTAISPHLATSSTYLLTESLFAFLATVSLYCLIRIVQKPDSSGWAVAAGLILSVACLVRPQLKPLPFVLVFVCFLVPLWRRHWRNALLGLTCFLALQVPWQMRNAGVERPAGEPDLLANTLYHGSFPDFLYANDPSSLGMPYRFDPASAEHSRDVPAALAWIREEFQQQPVRMLRWYLLGKPEFFLAWGNIAGGGDIFTYPVIASPYRQPGLLAATCALAFALHWPLMLLALSAVVLAGAKPHWLAADENTIHCLRMLGLCAGVILVMHMIGAPYPRYGVPFRPLFYLLALATVAAIWRRLEAKISASRHFIHASHPNS